jgi:DNA repair protein RadA
MQFINHVWGWWRVATVKGLEGVDQRLLDKLEGAGVQSVSDLATSTASELLEEYYSNYDDNGTGIDLETISQAVMKAKEKLIEDGLLHKDFSSAEDMLEVRKRLVRIAMGSQSLDLFLGGGIETQALTEIAGEFGSGKSQFCYTLCVTANMSNKENGIIFVDTENTFRAERVHQIAESRGLDTEEIMKKIFVCKIYYSAHLEAVIRSLSKYIEQYKARLVIIESIISLHRAEFAGRETLAERQQRLNTLLHKLRRLSQIYNIAVVYTNRVQGISPNYQGVTLGILGKPSSSITKVDCPNSPGRLMDDDVVVVAFSAVISYFNVFASGSYCGLKSSIMA